MSKVKIAIKSISMTNGNTEAVVVSVDDTKAANRLAGDGYTLVEVDADEAAYLSKISDYRQEFLAFKRRVQELLRPTK